MKITPETYEKMNEEFIKDNTPFRIVVPTQEAIDKWEAKPVQHFNPPPQVDPNAPQQQQGAPQQGEQRPPAGAQVQDTQGSGGGQVGTGTAPLPGEQGFTGNTG